MSQSHKNKADYYNDHRVKSALNIFRSRSKGYIDFAFDIEDQKQELAVAIWMLKSPTSSKLWRKLVDAFRAVSYTHLTLPTSP
jgi:hypothetical protein